MVTSYYPPVQVVPISITETYSTSPGGAAVNRHVINETFNPADAWGDQRILALFATFSPTESSNDAETTFSGLQVEVSHASGGVVNPAIQRAIATSTKTNRVSTTTQETRSIEAVSYIGLGDADTAIGVQIRRINTGDGGLATSHVGVVIDEADGDPPTNNVPYWVADSAGKSIMGGFWLFGDHDSAPSSTSTVEIVPINWAAGYTGLALRTGSAAPGTFQYVRHKRFDTMAAADETLYLSTT